MEKMDLGNGESVVRGVFANEDGTFTALLFTHSKNFKTRACAQRWFDKNTRD